MRAYEYIPFPELRRQYRQEKKQRKITLGARHGKKQGDKADKGAENINGQAWPGSQELAGACRYAGGTAVDKQRGRKKPNAQEGRKVTWHMQ